MSAATSHFLWKIKKIRPEWDVQFHINRFAVDVARCECVAEAREQASDFLIMVDDDVIGGEDVLRLPEHNAPVVSGLVPSWKLGRFHWATYDLTEDNIYQSISHDRLALGTGLRQVYAVGGALLCIRKDVLDMKEADPLFSLDRNADGTMNLFGGEDIMFCRKMHEYNIPVYVDPNILGEHIAPVEMALTMYGADRDGGKRDAGVDAQSRMSYQLVADVGEMPFSLPVSDSYRRLQQERQQGTLQHPAKNDGRISYSKLHLA